MPSPFPGMDPYLEAPELWPDVHHELISQIRAALNPQLRPRYVARIELRVYVSDEDDPGREVLIPDIRVEKGPKRKPAKAKKVKPPATVAVAEPLTVSLFLDDIEEARVEIRERPSDALVTVIEVLSPANKVRGSRGRSSFMDKRNEIVASDVHWVEIDLLRAGDPSLARLAPSDYRILVSRASQRTRAKYWPFGVRQPLPPVPIPLRKPDRDVPLDLGTVLAAAYDHGAYDLSVDYRREPDPPLSAEDAAWADELLRGHGLR